METFWTGFLSGTFILIFVSIMLFVLKLLFTGINKFTGNSFDEQVDIDEFRKAIANIFDLDELLNILNHNVGDGSGLHNKSDIIEVIGKRIIEVAPNNFEGFTFLLVSISFHREFKPEDGELFEKFYNTFNSKYDSFNKDCKDEYQTALYHYIYFCNKTNNFDLQAKLTTELKKLNPNYQKELSFWTERLKID